MHEEAVLASPTCCTAQKLVRKIECIPVRRTADNSFDDGYNHLDSNFLKEREAELRWGPPEEPIREEAPQSVLGPTPFQESYSCVGIPLINFSIEVAAELRALGDWHAVKGRWQPAAERFASLVKVNQLDGPEVSSLDQLRLAAALLQAGDRTSYNQWRRSVVAIPTPAPTSVPGALLKACLLLPAEPDLLQSIAAALNVDTPRNPSSPGNRPMTFYAASSDASVLLEYRRGN